MAKIDLKFLDDVLNEYITIECKCLSSQIIVKLSQGKSFSQIRLDKSTAIKFAKTLRTEINKIQS